MGEREQRNRRLNEAAGRGDLATVKKMAADGADLSWKNVEWFSQTPLHFASSCGHLEVVKFLASSGVDINLEDTDGWTALHLACFKNKADVASYLISLGAHLPENATRKPPTPVNLARRHPQLKDFLNSLDLAKVCVGYSQHK
eukprot:TRINITY_DN3716_c0_g1_i1.p1 TRINITY_DN3716_c0_g1~~TRINITY_DN3716_c0_g1_i1.p1  ORF type:complete len:143 (-),score=31.52 TRINITY_DN3716_c0_g1_i1:162-590(-)